MWKPLGSDHKSNYVHKVAQFFSAGWPVNFWRIDAMEERDYEWFETKYPGWYAEFGAWWDHYRELSEPGTPIVFADTGYVYPHRCWSCLVPVVNSEGMCVDHLDGELYTYCSEQCRWTHKVAFSDNYNGRPTPAMGRFSGRRQWEELYHGWDLADVIKDMDFVRDDGKTLVPQPHLHFDDSKMWTLDHVKGYEMRSPLLDLRALNEQEREISIAAYRAGFTIK